MKNKEHWDNQAKKYKGSLRATTMTDTIKRLELNALCETFSLVDYKTKIFEVGCGNGVNLKYLVKKYPKVKFTGMDYSKEMLKNAYKHENITYVCDNILNPKHKGEYDIVFTDRCLINIQDEGGQVIAFSFIANYVKNGGYLIIIENFKRDLEVLNKHRKALGFDEKKIAPFNKFLNWNPQLSPTEFIYLYSENFASLHDLILYVLNYDGKKVDYKAPIMKRVTELILKYPEVNYGNWGQNRIMVWRKI